MNDTNLVTQSNGLIEARYHEPLTARQQKIVLSVVSMVQPDDEDFKTYEIRIQDFHEMLGLEGDPKYTELKSITEKILKKSLEVTRDRGRFLQVNWFSSIEYFEFEGRMEFSFDPKLKPYLLDLKKAFTTYRLSNVLSLKSGYSIRLYELMKKWQHLGRWEVPVDSLKQKFGIPEDKYKQYGHFKSRIIKPSIQEVNEKTDVQVFFKEIRKGRKVVKIEFDINHVEEKEIKLDKPKQPEFDKELFFELNDLANGYEINLDGFKRMDQTAFEVYGEEREKQLRKLVRLVNELSGIKKPVGFMIHLLGEKAKLKEEGLSVTEIERQTSEILPKWFEEHKQEQSNKKETSKESMSKEEIEEIKAFAKSFQK